jgi:hypothetical protein
MKKIIYSLLLSCTAILFVGCDYQDPNEDKFASDSQTGWVEFENPTTTVVSGVGTSFNIPVILNAPVNKDGLTVNYTVTDVNGSTSGIVSYSGQATIPAGQLRGNISLSIPEAAVTSCIEFDVTLTSTNKSVVQVGFEDGTNAEHFTTNRVLLGKGRDSFIGTYNVVEGDATYQTTVTAGDEPNELIIKNLFDIDPNSETHIFLDTASSTGNVTFPFFTDNYLFTSTNPTQGDVFISNEFVRLLETEDPINSSFNPCTNVINLNYFLVFGPDQQSFSPSDGTSINSVMTKQ